MKAMIVVLAAAALAVAASRLSWAQDTGALTAQQVEKLQNQLADMQKQLAEMQQTIQASKMSAPQQQAMMGHMGMMREGMQGMQDQCCKMDPAHCPHMGGATP